MDQEINISQTTNKTLWKNRRYMAWVSIIALIIIACTAMFSNEINSENKSIVIAVIYVLGGVVLVYSGGASLVEAVKGFRK